MFCRALFSRITKPSRFLLNCNNIVSNITTAESSTCSYNNKVISQSRNGYCSMSFDLTEEQLQIQQTASRISDDKVKKEARKYDESGETPLAVMQQLWASGLLNSLIPSQYGGLDLGSLDATLITEEIARGCSGMATIMDASNMAQVPLIIAASSSLKKKYLSPMIEEFSLSSYCVAEPGAGSDVTAIKTRAIKEGDMYCINGTKAWATNASVANWFFVLAKTNPKARLSEAFTAFVVDANAEGITIGKKVESMGQRCCDVRSITFSDVLVPMDNVIGAVGAGYKITMNAFDVTRPLIGAGAVGLASRCLQEASNYALQRKTMGTEIANHQAVSFMLADMEIGIESARLAVRRAAWEIDEGRKNTYYASIAKALSADVANKSATDAVQIFGGYGFNTEYAVEKLMRDAKFYHICEGTSQIQRMAISKRIFDQATLF